MSSRWTGFFVWALVAASAAFWGLRIFAATKPVPAGALAPARAIAAAGAMPRLFGAVAEADTPEEAEAAASERFKLLGVIAPPDGAASGRGYALISIDNQPAKPWAVGKAVEGETVLLAVSKRSADLGPRSGPAAFTLELPALNAPATGTLPAPGAAAPAGVKGPGAPQPPAAFAGRMPNGQPVQVPPGSNPNMRMPAVQNNPQTEPGAVPRDEE